MQTPDIHLRFPVPADAPMIVEAVQESLSELQVWMSWAGPDYDVASAQSWIEMTTRARTQGLSYEFLIVDPAGQVLGACGINQVSTLHRFANLGYWVRAAATGQGVAAAAARQVADWVFANTDLQRLEIVVAQGNRRSERVAEKAGALHEGVLRARLLNKGVFHDAAMFSIVREINPSER